MSGSGAPPKPMSRTSVAWWPCDRIKGATLRGMDASTRKCTGSSCRQGTLVLLFHHLRGESERGPNVVGRDIVFRLECLEAVAARQAADDYRHRSARAANNRFTVADVGIDNNALVH